MGGLMGMTHTKQKRIYISPPHAHVSADFPLVQAYVSGINELIFKVCFVDGAPWLSPVMRFQLSCYIIWITATAKIKENREACCSSVHVMCMKSKLGWLLININAPLHALPIIKG